MIVGFSDKGGFWENFHEEMKRFGLMKQRIRSLGG